MCILNEAFFDQDACEVARQLLGKVIRRKYKQQWLAARIIETEAYYLEDKGSHASLGFTKKRKALFMPPGTIYMYYARGHDSLNVSCRGKGNAVLIKSAFAYADTMTDPDAIATMQALNPLPSGSTRAIEKLCSGQTLLCRSLNLKVTEWDQKLFDPEQFYIDDVPITPKKIIHTTRMGIPKGRDEALPYRFIDFDFARYCTSNPLTRRLNITHGVGSYKIHTLQL
jgi:DNA-3-methyladenine glycosylase